MAIDFQLELVNQSRPDLAICRRRFLAISRRPEQWIKFFVRIINEAARKSIMALQKYEAAIKLDEERIKTEILQTRSTDSVYEFLKLFPISSIPFAAAYLKMSYNSVAKVFDVLQKNKLIEQESDGTRNRTWEYSNLSLCFDS